nr:MAG: ORF1 [Torque teno midi virus]
MPFWWNRRRKPWYGRWRHRRRFQRYKRRKPRRRFTRRRNRRFTRRRRRKRKVRRKRKKINIQQWQPESIVKCKIKGFSTLVLGAEGRQYICWTNETLDYTQPKAPGGGGFGCENITLEWLYHEYRAHNCIWTKSNQYKDLCRYTGCRITLFRHPNVDFIFQYNLQGPFNITKLTYADIQPQNMLLQPHHKLILSQKTKPHGKLAVKVKIKPPKQMTTRWFFAKEFSEAVLVQLKAVACTFTFPRIAPKAQSQMVTVYYLNESFYPSPIWGQVHSGGYIPITTKTGKYKFSNTKAKPPYQDFIIDTTKFHEGQVGYYESINYSTGFFTAKVLNASKVTINDMEFGSLPLLTARYNPNNDSGDGNVVYAVSILQHSYAPPTVQSDYVIRGQPLWMAFHGFWSWIKYLSKDKAFYTHYMFIVQSPAIKPISQNTAQKRFAFLDLSFISGKLPFDEYLSENEKQLWYPKAQYQTETINAFVESGPFIPKLSNIPESTWELDYKYNFYFKWGGPQITDRPVDDPQYQPDYPVPGYHSEAVQISNPKTLATESLLHEWDFRRGIVTHTALKRMSENFESETDIYSDDSGTPKKKRKITKELPYQRPQQEALKTCLQELCEENTCQETPQTLQELIQQQQQQQQQLKHNILQLLTKLKKDQRFLGLQTGLLE